MASENRPVLEVVAKARAVIYDFDGPVCDVFSGSPARKIARDLMAISRSVFDTDDPLEVIRGSDSQQLALVEDALVAAEIAAVETSDITPGSLESIEAAFSANKRVAVVSNNSGAAVESFFSRVGLSGRVWPVIGRAYRMPGRMKPHPWPMRTALDALALAPAETVFVGDSMTDVEVARECRVPCVGYANKPGKREAMADGGATVIESMWALQRFMTRLAEPRPTRA